MGSSSWSDNTAISTIPTELTEFTDEQKKQISKYCEEYQDQPWSITAEHFSKVFGGTVTAEQINSIYIEKLVG